MTLTGESFPLHWRIQWGARNVPPLGPIVFIFMQFRHTSCQIIVFLSQIPELAHPSLAKKSWIHHCTVEAIIVTIRNSSCRKVMFSQASVILSTGGRCTTPGQTSPLGETPPGRHPPGRFPSWTYNPPPPAVQTPPRQTPPPPQTATAAHGTHPTGMHSCIDCIEERCQNAILFHYFRVR